MASIHVIYDPANKITGLTPEQLKTIGASAIVMHIDEPIFVTKINEVVRDVVDLLIEQIAIDE